MAKAEKKIISIKSTERKRVRKPVGMSEINTLSKFSEALAEMAERKRKEDATAVKLAKRVLPEKISELKTFDIEHLFDLYDSALNGGYSNPKMMVVLVKWKGAIKEEIISRIPVAKRKAK